LPIKNNKKIPQVTTTTQVVRSPGSGLSTRSINRYNNDGKVEPFGSFSSSKNSEKTMGGIKSGSKDETSNKKMNHLSNSFDNSPGKLMYSVNSNNSHKYRAPKQSPPFGQSADFSIKEESPNTFDFSHHSESELED
jgi:hypothetical protein